MKLFLIQAFRPVFSVFFAILSMFYNLAGQPTIPHGQELNLDGYELVWADEFDGDCLDTSRWGGHYFADDSTIIRGGCYWTLSMVTVEDGALHIGVKYLENGIDGNGPAGWYSAGIDTAKSYKPTYGYYECRCILPKGSGLWSAFWLLSDKMGNVDGSGADGNEVDIFESAYYHSDVSNSVSGAIHYDGYGEDLKSTSAYYARIIANNPYEEYNTYGLEWTEDEYIFYINGVEAGRSSFGGVCTSGSRIILSVEVGGSNAVPASSWSGDSIDTNTFAPTDFIVDYVRVYEGSSSHSNGFGC